MSKENKTRSHFFLILSFVLFFIFTHQAIAEEQDNKKFRLPTSVTLTAEDQLFEVSKEDISRWAKINPKILVGGNQLAEIEKEVICPQKKIVCAIIFSVRSEEFRYKTEIISTNTESIRKFMEAIAPEINKEPRNALFRFENDSLSERVPSENGSSLNINESVEQLEERLKNNNLETNIVFPLSLSVKEPELTIEKAKSLGITSLIGTGTSNFRGSPPNRIHNIKTAIEKFDGTLIAPGEEFSFVEQLGPVDEEHGYKAELVIKKDKTEPEFGGGICQVSTTTFRAAIYSGLKITARKNHAYPVSYYNPQGMDATIYIPYPDLRFKNNTAGHILIQPSIEGTVLTFDFYGTNDERTTSIDGPHILIRNSDGSMNTTFTQTVTLEDGTELIKDIFNSFYDSPSKYPHPGETLTSKPDDWSNKEWKEYKKNNP